MKSIFSCRQYLLAALSVVLSISSAYTQDKDWRPVSPEELSSKPQVQPNADAEVFFWEVRVDDSNSANMVMKHYIRVKVFTERGREKYSKVDIPFTKGIRVKDISARVIKPDGSIMPLAKADVFDREIVKTDKVKVKAKSFAVPGIEPGVVLEYRYQEVYSGGTAEDMRMVFQHDVPIRNITYYFKPWESSRYLTFNMNEKRFEKDKGGFYKATLENVPAIEEEPHMPPEDEVRSWLLLYYTQRHKDTATDFWSRFGGYIVAQQGVRDTLKPGKELKAAAAEIAAGAASDDEKLAKLFDFCKTMVRNITYDTSLTDEQKEEIKPNNSTSNTYKKLQGTAVEINELFASLAAALGYETRLAYGGDKSEKFFNVNQAHESFIHFTGVAVKVNERWQFYSPGDLFVPRGMLAWNEEDTAVLLLGHKDYTTSNTPISRPEKSMERRTGKFKLHEDGTFEGTVSIEYTGHLSTKKKLDNYKESAAKREENLKEMIRARLGTAELSNVSIENVADPEKPFVYRFNVRVPNYAQRTGRRIILQPGVFEFGTTPVFTSATRKYPIFFHHSWSEHDSIEIELPKGFEIDSGDSPSPIADSDNVGSLRIGIALNRQNGILKYDRRFHFGGGGNILFPLQAYAPLKMMFDRFNEADSHAISLRQVQ